jgi:hypothetical protein
MNVLVLNAGQLEPEVSSYRYGSRSYQAEHGREVCRGVVKRIGGEAIITIRTGKDSVLKTTAALRDMGAALGYVLQWLTSGGLPAFSGKQSAADQRMAHTEHLPDECRIQADARKPESESMS